MRAVVVMDHCAGDLRRRAGRLVSEEGFSCMVDILLKLRTMDLSFAEVPMILRYDLKGGASKMNVPRTVLRTLKLLLTYNLFNFLMLTISISF